MIIEINLEQFSKTSYLYTCLVKTNNKQMKSIAAVLLILISTSTLAQTTSLNLASDVWPPFTNVEEEKSIAMDIVNEALLKNEITTNYEIVDFGMVMEGIALGKFDGSGALWKDKSREETLMFSDAYLQNQLILVGKKGSDVQFTSFSELDNKRIGVVENYAYGDSLLSGKDNQIIYGSSDQQNLERLFSGQIDYFLVDALLIQYLLKFQLNDVRELLEIGEYPLIVKSLHLAIRKDFSNAEQVLNDFNRAIKTMMADGSYNEILELNWVSADVDGDGKLELILAGNEAGKAAPEYSYNILYSDQNLSAEGYYVDGKMFQSWEDVPNEYKVDIPRVDYQPGLDDATMKIKF